MLVVPQACTQQANLNRLAHLPQSSASPQPVSALVPWQTSSPSTAPKSLNMSHSSNPYAQGGWSNPSTPNTQLQFATPHAPTFGALPPSSAASSPNVINFQFNSPSGDTLNSTVTDSTYRTYFVISTTPGPVKITTFSTADGVPFATVEWSSPPFVTIKNRVPRQDATKWLLFSRDRG